MPRPVATPPAPQPTSAMSDASAGECCARAQAESWARAEARRFAPRPSGALVRLRTLLARLARRARGLSGA